MQLHQYFIFLFCVAVPTEKTVFVREHLNYWYSLKSFYFAKTSADIPFQVVFSMIYITIVYFMTAQPFEVCRFLMVSLMCIFTSLISQSLGLLIGAAMRVEACFLIPTKTRYNSTEPIFSFPEWRIYWASCVSAVYSLLRILRNVWHNPTVSLLANVY